jgi:hypothetical protein
MSNGVKIALGFALLVLALLAGHFNLDEVITGDKLLDGLRLVVGLIGAALLIGGVVAALKAATPQDITQQGITQKERRLLVTAAVLILLAVYLPELKFGEFVKWLFDSRDAPLVDASEQAAALTWARAVLTLGALAALAAARFRIALEVTAGVFGVLLVVAAVAATGDALAALDSPPAQSKTSEAAFDRGFTLPAAKLQAVSRDLRQNSCVTVDLVVGTDPDTSDAKNALVYETRPYKARLVRAVTAGAASDDVPIELSEANDRFASDLFSAASIHLLSSDTAQKDDAVCNATTIR